MDGPVLLKRASGGNQRASLGRTLHHQGVKCESHQNAISRGKHPSLHPRSWRMLCDQQAPGIQDALRQRFMNSRMNGRQSARQHRDLRSSMAALKCASVGLSVHPPSQPTHQQPSAFRPLSSNLSSPSSPLRRTRPSANHSQGATPCRRRRPTTSEKQHRWRVRNFGEEPRISRVVQVHGVATQRTNFVQLPLHARLDVCGLALILRTPSLPGFRRASVSRDLLDNGDGPCVLPSRQSHPSERPCSSILHEARMGWPRLAAMTF